MVLKIRLARFGRRRAPFYNIVVAHARTARNSRPLEVIGTYDPIPKLPDPAHTDVSDPASLRKHKDIRLDTARAQYWLGVGAQPSEPMARILGMLGLVERQWKGDGAARVKALAETQALAQGQGQGQQQLQAEEDK